MAERKTYSLSGIPLSFSSSSPRLLRHAAPYETEEAPCFVIPDEGLAPSTLLERVAYLLLDRGRLLCHAAVLLYRGAAYAFLGESGRGKTTHTSLWLEEYGSAVSVLADDKPFFCPEGEGVTVYTSPWLGKEGRGSVGRAPLRALVFLERGQENVIESLSPAEAFPLLYGQTLRPSEPLPAMTVLGLCEALLGRVPSYRLYCNKERQAARVAFSAIVKEEDHE